MVTKKSVRTLIMFACGIALVLAWSSCSKKPDEPPAPPEPNNESKIPAIDEPPAPPEVNNESKVPTPIDTEPKIVEPPKVTDDKLQVVPAVGVGPVKFGMSKEEVMEHFGQPDRMEGGGIALFYLKSKGLSLLVDPARGLREINCWSKDYPGAPEMTTFAGRTEKGIGIAAGREQIVAAYGEPDKTDSRGSLEVLHYNELRIQFVLAGDKLVNIKIAAP